MVEGAGAAALAAVLAGKVSGRAIVLPVCGRNIDVKVHASILEAHSQNVPQVVAQAA